MSGSAASGAETGGGAGSGLGGVPKGRVEMGTGTGSAVARRESYADLGAKIGTPLSRGAGTGGTGVLGSGAAGAGDGTLAGGSTDSAVVSGSGMLPSTASASCDGNESTRAAVLPEAGRIVGVVVLALGGGEAGTGIGTCAAQPAANTARSASRKRGSRRNFRPLTSIPARARLR